MWRGVALDSWRGQPGAKEQRPHKDNDVGYSIIIAVTERQFHFKHLAQPLTLRAGQFLLFSAALCLWGAGLSKAAPRPSLAVHLFGGTAIDGSTIGEELIECLRGM